MMTDIRKIVTLREVVYSELGHKAARPIVRARSASASSATRSPGAA
jgi:hypothetical protein